MPYHVLSIRGCGGTWAGANNNLRSAASFAPFRSSDRQKAVNSRQLIIGCLPSFICLTCLNQNALKIFPNKLNLVLIQGPRFKFPKVCSMLDDHSLAEISLKAHQHLKELTFFWSITPRQNKGQCHRRPAAIERTADHHQSIREKKIEGEN